LPASRVARVWVSPERARWARELRPVVEELEEGALVVELPFAGTQWLVREVLKEAGDAAVLEPADARQAVLAAGKDLAERLPRTSKDVGGRGAGTRGGKRAVTAKRRPPRKARAAA